MKILFLEKVATLLKRVGCFLFLPKISFTKILILLCLVIKGEKNDGNQEKKWSGVSFI